MRTIELFAGGGGVALALRSLGIDCVAHAELDAAACDTLRLHGFAGVQRIDLSVTDPDVDGPIDLLWASPPCQPFSSAGRLLGAEDPRDGFPWVHRIVAKLRPTWVVIENVSGLTRHRKGHGPRCPACYLDRQLVRLRESYAHVQTWLLDAADYGVPQHRRRVFIVAGPSRPARPTPTHGDPALYLAGRLPWRTMGEALGLLTDEPSTTVPAPRADQPAATITHEVARADGSRGNASITLDRPSPVVSATEEKGAGNRATRRARGEDAPGSLDRASDALLLGTGRRRLTVAECAVLQGFPADYHFVGWKRDQYRQVGNAVPPPLALAVLRAVVEDR